MPAPRHSFVLGSRSPPYTRSPLGPKPHPSALTRPSVLTRPSGLTQDGGFNKNTPRPSTHPPLVHPSPINPLAFTLHLALTRPSALALSSAIIRLLALARPLP